MSDDDLWRRKDADRQPGDEAGSTDEPEHAGTDETQPITGTSPSPPPGPTPDSPPPPPSPSYHQPTGPGAVPPPQNPYAQSSGQQQNPYGGQPAAGQPYPTQPGPYAGQPYGGQPYGGQPYGGQPYGGQPYGAPPNPYRAPGEYTAPQSPYGSPYHPAYAGGMVPDHPSATTSMVLGIIGLVGIFVCAGITLILSPAAWIVGAKAVREIDATPGRYGGRDRAQAGKIMGIIGTVLLALGIVAIIGVVALAVSSGSNDPTPITPNPTFQNG